MSSEKTDRSQRHTPERRNMLARDMFERLLELAPDAIVIVDGSGRIRLVNAEAERLFGYQREELLGQPVEMLLPERFREFHQGHRDRYAAAPQPRPMGIGLELYGRRKDGSEFPTEISLSPWETNDGLLVTSVIRDVTERKLAEEARAQLIREQSARAEAEAARATLRAMIQASPVPIILVDLSGKIQSWNPAAERLLGWTEAEVLGRSIPGAPEGDQDELLAVLDRVRQGESVINLDVRRRTKAGSWVNLSISAAPVLEGNGRPGGTTWVLKDISHRKRAEASRVQLAAAQEAVRVREEFLSIASHELKTPITVIKGYTQMLAARISRPGTDPKRVTQIIGELQEQARRLEMLVVDLLDGARIQQGRLDLRPEPVDLASLARRLLTRFEQMPERTNRHRLVVQGPEMVTGNWDPARLDQALTNLVSNALKYSPDGGEVCLRLRDVDSGHVEVAVSDQGIGISEEEQKKLFQPFSRGGATRSIHGTGLGLYLTSRIVEQHGGTITVTSTPGCGSTFTIRLPRTQLN